MKEEISKGIFWGLGIGISLSGIFIIWIVAIVFMENIDKPNEWEDYGKHDLTIDKYVYRFKANRYSEMLVVSGSLAGTYPNLNENTEGLIWIYAKIYNKDNIFIERCGKNYLIEHIGKSLEFRIECDDVFDEGEVGSIEFEINVQTRKL